jgi:hypothetical protein
LIVHVSSVFSFCSYSLCAPWWININKLYWLIAISFCNIQNMRNMMLYIVYVINNIMVETR